MTSTHHAHHDAGPVIQEVVLHAPAEKVWNALTDPAEMKKWYFDIPEFKAEPGFQFQFYGEGLKGERYLHLCTVLEAVPLKKLRYTWRYQGYEGESVVTFELFPEAEQTTLRLTHEGLERFASDQPDFARQNFVEGWTYLLHTSIKNHLDP